MQGTRANNKGFLAYVWQMMQGTRANNKGFLAS